MSSDSDPLDPQVFDLAYKLGILKSILNSIGALYIPKNDADVRDLIGDAESNLEKVQKILFEKLKSIENRQK
ncbi:hypothetical protein [Leptospira stimsonii]|uniref:Uncharacterized protein n=1 Tax=Leptospira stimsonii TaxID=2202203 RepID=A0ABY2N550_9LEPT|nr:hypothetical protein [Leptospira stimsonii]TGK10395.1 hypothetical protein EHO98_23075 [Leptospira stimsonii]TGM17262.1 hypothetical protein EHQ90_07720 [Leptospira stimsonii]